MASSALGSDIDDLDISDDADADSDNDNDDVDFVGEQQRNGWRRLRRVGWCVTTSQFVRANLILLSLMVWSSLDLVSSPDGGARSSPPLTVAELDGIDPAFLVALEGLPQSPRPDVTSDDA